VTLRFLHVADVHLDSPLKGVSASLGMLPDRLARSTVTAFRNAIDAAIAHDVDALLVAGDVYDRKDRSVRARVAYLTELERLHAAGIRAFVVHGNHDPLEPALVAALPSSVTTFGTKHHEVACTSRHGVPFRVQGISFGSAAIEENLSLQFTRKSAEVTVGVLHCNVGLWPQHSNYAPTTLEDLDSARLDYWALGHVHQQQVMSLPSGGVAAYPGNLQARHVGEAGPRGCLLVEVDEEHRWPARTQFIACDDVRWHQKEVSLDGVPNIEALVTQLECEGQTCVASAPALGHVIRFRLVGRSPMVARLARPGACEELELGLSERVDWWVESIQLAAQSPHEPHAIVAAGGFAAELAAPLLGQSEAANAALAADDELKSLEQLLAKVQVPTFQRLAGTLAAAAASAALDALEGV
jgi:DNA repair protein SbcD/Mre11